MQYSYLIPFIPFQFIRPICHLEIVGDDITFMMDCNDLLETRKGEKTSINKDEIGFHICAEQIICRYNNDCEKIFFTFHMDNFFLNFSLLKILFASTDSNPKRNWWKFMDLDQGSLVWLIYGKSKAEKLII